MKRFTLLLMGAVLLAGASFGYDFKKYPGLALTAMSPDGKYLIYGEDYVGVMILNTVTGDTLYYEEGAVEDSLDGEAISYGVGMGNIANKQGMIVGCYTQRDAGYFLDGQWYALPGIEGYAKGLYTQGNGVSADGSVICGSLGVGNDWLTMLERGGTTYLPGVWTKQADGTYKCELLPYPTKDFTGRAPQYITALCVSDDGNTIAGQVRSFDGFTNYPIIYTRDADGKWAYKLYGLEYIVKDSVEFPPYPSYEPKSPKVQDYLTEAELAAYSEAYTAYNDSLSMYYAGLITTWPKYPTQKDFLSADSAVAYNAAYAKYEEEYAIYSDSCAVFDAVYDEAWTGASFVYNTMSMSANGKYLAQTLESEDPNADPFDWWSVSSLDSPVLFDLSNGGLSTQVNTTSMQPSSVTNNGMMIACSPAVEYSRQAYIIPQGTTEPIPFLQWMSAKCDTASIWVKENMAYDIISVTYDEETWEETITTYEDSVQTGTMICNPDGNMFCAYTYDQWTEDETNVGYTSYFLDITDPLNPTAIQAIVRNGGNGLKIVAAKGKISVDGDVANVCVYDMAGRKIASGNGSVDVNSGLYMVKAIGTDGKVTTKKVSVAK